YHRPLRCSDPSHQFSLGQASLTQVFTWLLHTTSSQDSPGLARGGASRPSAPMPGAVSMGSMAGSSPPPLQISPPLHQHLSLHQQQQQLSSHPLPLHSPSMAQ
ncbi:hypothetical protein M9458_003724, partial [Cirrhinus mrigala]